MSDDNSRAAPITGESIVTKLLNDQKKQQDVQAIRAEEIEEYKTALNQIAQSPAGMLVLKKLIRYCNVFGQERYDPSRMVEASVRRQVYMTLIRPYLDKTSKIELED